MIDYAHEMSSLEPGAYFALFDLTTQRTPGPSRMDGDFGPRPFFAQRLQALIHGLQLLNERSDPQQAQPGKQDAGRAGRVRRRTCRTTGVTGAFGIEINC